MLRQKKPSDYVIATGESRSVREFVNEAFTEDGEKRDDMVATPSKKACKWCEFRKTEYCKWGV